jgi:ParB family chromosome partitioning protein
VAKSERRGGLGRGLGSLLPGSYDAPAQPAARPNQDRVVIDEGNQAPYQEENTEQPSVAQPVREQRVMVEISDEGTALTEPVERVIAPSIPPTEEIPEVAIKETDEISLDLIEPNPDQPRTQFKKEEIQELAASIEKDGLLQPLLVRKLPQGTYQIIAGERRWQASKALGLKTVPVRIKEANDDEALELALIENIQRSDLNPIEEAYGYRRLMERRSMTQAEVAQAVSKGRSTVANALRLLDLPEEAQQLLFEEKITAGHARAILSVPTSEGRLSLTQQIVENNLTVREAENIARLMAGKKGTNNSSRSPLPPVYKSVAKTLRDTLKTNVKVKSVKGKNKIEIEFKDEEDLQRLFGSLITKQSQ